MMQVVSNEEANDLADEILLREEFLPASGPGFFERTTDRVISAILDALAWLFEGLFGVGGGGAGSGLAILLGVLAVSLLGLAIFRAIRDRQPKEKLEDDDGTRIVFDEVVDARSLRVDLSVARESGRWRSAIIASFRLAIIGLIDEGVARERQSATTGDFGRDVAAQRPELSEGYADSARVFERAFYSDLDVSETDFLLVEDFRNQVERAIVL